LPGAAPARARITGRVDLMGAVIPHALVWSTAAWMRRRVWWSHHQDCADHRQPPAGVQRHPDARRGHPQFPPVGDRGLLRLDRAQVTGDLSLYGAQVGDGSSVALAGTGLIVESDMECSAGFAARGQVNLRGGRIAGGSPSATRS